MSHLVKVTKENFLIYQKQILDIERLSFPSPWKLNAFIAEIKKPISHIWAITAEKSLWGYICFWMFDSEIQILNIAVHPLKRGQNFGWTLLAKMLEISDSNDIRYIWLEVRPSNRPARKMYQKIGFQEVGRRPGYYPDTNEEAIIMALELSRQGFPQY